MRNKESAFSLWQTPDHNKAIQDQRETPTCQTCTAPAIMPLRSISLPSRKSTINVLPSLIIARAWAGEIRGTTASANWIICLRFVAVRNPVMGSHQYLVADVTKH
jgi:hypothetical protein